MTITRRWQTGFELGANAGEISFGNSTISTGAPKTGTYDLQHTSNSQSTNDYQLVIPTRQGRGGFWVRHGAAGAGGFSFLFRIYSGATALISIRIQASTSILELQVAGVAQDTYTSVPVDTYYHLGYDVKIDSSAGWAKFYINGVLSLEFSGNTGNADLDKIQWGPNSAGSSDTIGAFYLDDPYFDDTTSEAAPAAPPILYFPYVTLSGNGNYAQWDGSDGNSVDNYALVDEIPPNSDTDYVETNVANEIESYAANTITLVAGQSILAVIPTVFMKRTGNTEQVALGTRYSSTDLAGSDQTPPNSYGVVFERQTTKPGGGAWDQSALDGMEILVKARGTY